MSVNHCFKYKWYFVKKKKKGGASSVHNSNNCTRIFSQDKHLLMCNRSSLCVLPISSHKILKSRTQGAWFNKIRNFCCLAREFVSKTGILFSSLRVMKKTITPGTVWCHCLDSFYGAWSFSHDCFWTIIANMKRTSNI